MPSKPSGFWMRAAFMGTSLSHQGEALAEIDPPIERRPPRPLPLRRTARRRFDTPAPVAGESSDPSHFVPRFGTGPNQTPAISAHGRSRALRPAVGADDRGDLLTGLGAERAGAGREVLASLFELLAGEVALRRARLDLVDLRRVLPEDLLLHLGGERRIAELLLELRRDLERPEGLDLVLR